MENVWNVLESTRQTVRFTCLSAEQVVNSMYVNSSKSNVQRDVNYLRCPFSRLGNGSAWGRTALWPSCCERLLLNQLQGDWCDTSQFNLLTTWLPRPHKPPETLKRRLRFISTQRFQPQICHWEMWRTSNRAKTDGPVVFHPENTLARTERAAVSPSPRF